MTIQVAGIRGHLSLEEGLQGCHQEGLAETPGTGQEHVGILKRKVILGIVCQEGLKMWVLSMYRLPPRRIRKNSDRSGFREGWGLSEDMTVFASTTDWVRRSNTELWMVTGTRSDNRRCSRIPAGQRTGIPGR